MLSEQQLKVLRDAADKVYWATNEKYRSQPEVLPDSYDMRDYLYSKWLLDLFQHIHYLNQADLARTAAREAVVSDRRIVVSLRKWIGNRMARMRMWQEKEDNPYRMGKLDAYEEIVDFLLHLEGK